MIIFGTRGVTYSAGKGDFHCPECGSQLPYNHKRVRRFFTLYFIPLIPLDSLGEYVECQQCRGTYRPEVLDFDPQTAAAEFEVEFHLATRRVMVHMLLADGVVDPSEIQVIRQIYRDLTGSELTEADVRAEIDQVQREGQNMATSLGPFAGQLNDEGREMVTRAAFLVAAADGEYHANEQALLADIGRTLGMSDAHVNGVVSSLCKE